MLRAQRFLFLLLSLLVLTTALQAQRAVDDGDRVSMLGNVYPMARSEFDRGPADATMPMNNMILSLNVRPDAQAGLKQFLAQLQDPHSPNYHKWLTPEQFGAKFGPSDQDIADVTAWLTRHGFKIEQVGKGRMWINFSGTVAQVEQAFQTNIRVYQVRGIMHHGNSVDPTMPRAFTGLVNSVVTMHDFPKQHYLSSRSQLPPDFTDASGSNFLAPADFATIYDVNPLYSAGITGAGQTIAIVGRTDIQLADVQYFRSFFGLPANDPVFINNGTDPGDLGGDEETEADLDVEWSGAVGQGATIKFVISASTATTDGVDLSSQYIVNNNTAPIVSTSYGLCEASMGAGEGFFYQLLYQEAATQGQTVFVASGDSGAADCDAPTAGTGTGLAVSGLASTAYNVAVGGTEFNEAGGSYWNFGNDPTTQGSAISYIPEVAWNESGSNNGSGLLAGGGGVSTFTAKPAFQTGTGVPADGMRDLPDVALSAAVHDGYLIIQGHTATTSGLESVGGTSAAAPSFAGLMSLVLQKTGSAQGNANTVFYAMGNNQQFGGLAVFHDITSGNNTVPGVIGYNAGTGYDLVTGWGSVDAANLVNFWNNNPAPGDFTLAASPASVTVNQGAGGSSTITITPSGGFIGNVTLSVSGLPTGVTAAFATNPTTSTSVLTLTASSTATTGTATLTITGAAGTLSHTMTIALTVNPGSIPPQQLLGNPGFENATASPWTLTSGVLNSSHAEPPHSGNKDAWLCGYGTWHTDTASQTVTIPAGANTATLSFWLHVDTAEPNSTGADDTLRVQVLDSTGATVLATLGTYSNLDHGFGYHHHSFNVIQFKGQTVMIRFIGKENGSLQTSFVIDDTALNVQ